MTFVREIRYAPLVIGPITHRFEIVLRPLRDKDGARQTVHLNARTAAQATREATARWPEMKVVSVARAEARVAGLPAEETDAAAPMRRTGN